MLDTITERIYKFSSLFKKNPIEENSNSTTRLDHFLKAETTTTPSVFDTAKVMVATETPISSSCPRPSSQNLITGLYDSADENNQCMSRPLSSSNAATLIPTQNFHQTKEKLEENKVVINHLETELNKFRSQFNEINSDLLEHTNFLVIQQTEATEQNEISSAHENQIFAYQKNCFEKNAAIQNLDLAISLLKNQQIEPAIVQKIEEKRDSLHNKLDDIKDTLEEYIKYGKSQTENVEEKIKLCKTTISTLIHKMSSLESKIDFHNTQRIELIKTRIDELKTIEALYTDTDSQEEQFLSERQRLTDELVHLIKKRVANLNLIFSNDSYNKQLIHSELITLPHELDQLADME